MVTLHKVRAKQRKERKELHQEMRDEREFLTAELDAEWAQVYEELREGLRNGLEAELMDDEREKAQKAINVLYKEGLKSVEIELDKERERRRQQIQKELINFEMQKRKPILSCTFDQVEEELMEGARR